MIIKIIVLLTALSINQGCIHTVKNKNEIATNDKIYLYKNLAQLIKKYNSKNLLECNCMKAFYRNLLAPPNKTARYIFDEKVAEIAKNLKKDKIDILALGSGKLLNELTAFANILSKGINLNIYLLDFNYIFYDDKNFKENALKMKNNASLIPTGWQYFDVWENFKDKKDQELITFFSSFHNSIDEFKIIIKELDKIYNTKSKIHVIKPAMIKPNNNYSLDMIISIDAYMDLPNLVRNLYYKLHTTKDKYLKFISLNKHISKLGFFENNNMVNREKDSQKPVTIEIHDVKINQSFIDTKLIEKINIRPTDNQHKDGLNFSLNPDIDTEYSPLKSKE